MFYYTCIHLFWFKFSTTHIEKLHESKICLSGRMAYSFLTSKKSEGRCTENLRHVILKVRR